mgnify:CR=1 FL=1
MLNAKSLLAKPEIKEHKKFQNAKARYAAHIDKDIYDMMLCGCGPAIVKVVLMTEGEVFTGDYPKSGEKVKVSFLKSGEFTDILDSSKYRVTELVERAILKVMRTHQ